MLFSSHCGRRNPLLGLLFALLSLLGLEGCITQSKLPYLQGAKYSTETPTNIDNAPPAYHIQPNDVLSVRVQSAQSSLTEQFNLNGTQSIYSGDPGTLYLSGYPVDEAGNVTLPTAGKVSVRNLTIEQAQRVIQQQVTRYIRDANVLVKLLSFKITVLGEVRTPGRYFIYNPQATLLEGLGMAGDLTEFGNRKNIKLIRQTAKGSEVVLLNLTDPKLLQSPYYYLRPNDALYVEPLRARAARGNVTNLALVFSGISAVVLLLTFALDKK
ncbi:polysaccharide biosynthesis/export family protein [Hymenobacter sp. GOD-10R]|uniref:polysaccharide biosynthesis/export family protein n=1 Tax=Hymenobacter sp. GOD-10R TaxID=3093922 RepID=UPI002D77B74C|nr:polysaccharide biosynthesis/export family protein [Hymenobacter sp. GOD-10R]WRQ28803.1 polysaccharide biosynthesis/export family protein [Hymenobacter sp. GOD-10R]